MGHGFTSLGDWSPWPPESDWEEVVGINLIRFGELSIAAMSSYHKSLKYCGTSTSLPKGLYILGLQTNSGRLHYDGYQNGGSNGKRFMNCDGTF